MKVYFISRLREVLLGLVLERTILLPIASSNTKEWHLVQPHWGGRAEPLTPGHH